jgi:hypothetical protein
MSVRPACFFVNGDASTWAGSMDGRAPTLSRQEPLTRMGQRLELPNAFASPRSTRVRRASQ